MVIHKLIYLGSQMVGVDKNLSTPGIQGLLYRKIKYRPAVYCEKRFGQKICIRGKPRPVACRKNERFHKI